MLRTETFGAAESKRIYSPGTYFRLQSCLYPVDVRFERAGQFIEEVTGIEAGTAIRPNGGFDSIIITSATAQTVKWFWSIGSLNIDRIAGEVSVIDGAYARSLANSAFIGRITCGALAANYSHVQLWNPSGSGVNLVVNQYAVSSGTAQNFYLLFYGTQLSTLYGINNPYAKLGNGSLSSAQQRIQQNGALLGNIITAVPLLANQPFLERMTEPLVIPPNYGLMWSGSVVNTDINAYPHFYAQSIT